MSDQVAQNVYYADGNFMLRATRGSDQDMFTMAQRSSGEGQELPLLNMSDDAGELEEFLQVLYEPERMIPTERYSEDFARAMLVPLRLADKYDSPLIIERIVGQIRIDYPETFEAYFLRDQELGLHGRSAPSPVPYIALVRAGALEHQLHRSLALMLYDASCLGPLGHAPGLDSTTYDGAIVGRYALFSRFASIVKIELNCQGDEQREVCDHQDIWIDLISDALLKPCLFVFLTNQACQIQWTHASFGRHLCASCAYSIVEHLKSLRATLFAKLPDFFL
ncbi:hypothetical protein HGRIS_013884 [Hohenbuehelia grisea]|uniref:Uncharacterized protein n=1 Tax=Hohenbuehelia grisea TaxID=104357 RepID=A0ABR3IX10_9AGAR